MKSLLVILNPRNIPDCMASYEALDIDRCYLTGYTEPQLAEAQKEVPNDYDKYLLVSDDCIVSQQAVDAVLRFINEERPVVTGYCCLDSTKNRGWVNLSYKPILDPVPRMDNYEFMRRIDVQTHAHSILPTSFVGMSLTGLTNEIWRRFPFQVCHTYNGQSDYSLSYRLTMAGVPMWAARDGYVTHVKQRWNEPDTDPEKRLLIGEVEPEVRLVTRILDAA